MNAVTFTDRVVRGDLSFVKKNADTEETLAYIPFRITIIQQARRITS